MAEGGTVQGTAVEPGGDERGLQTRRRLVPYYLLGPAGAWLLVFLFLPMLLIAYTSLQSGGILSGVFHFSWELSNSLDGVHVYHVFFIRSVAYQLFVNITTSVY